MKHFKNILYLSEASVDQTLALSKAISLAVRHQGRLTLLEVIPSVRDKLNPLPKGLDLTALENQLVTERREALTALVEAIAADIEVSIEITIGKPFVEAIRKVLSSQHDLLIKPVENPAWLTRIFGSDDMHLLRKCPCPLWLIKSDENTYYRNVMAAVDFDANETASALTDLNRTILSLSSDIALAADIPLQIVHCWQPPDEMLFKAWGNLNEDQARTYIQEEKQAHQLGLQTLADFLRQRVSKPVYDSGFAHFHLLEGSANTAIPSSARSLDADLLVMGTVARTGISGLFIGNTAEAVFEQIDCSVLVVKPEGFISPISITASV